MFQVMLAVQNNQSSDLDLDGLSFSDVEIKSNNAKFDLSLNVEENESGLSFCWEYSTDLFNRASIENLANSFTLLFEAMTENSSAARSQYHWLIQRHVRQSSTRTTRPNKTIQGVSQLQTCLKHKPC